MSETKSENPINPHNIFYAIGAAAVIWVAYSFNQTVESQSEKLDQLTTAVNKLVLVNESQNAELGERGDWMKGVDTYSEQSRMFDQQHTQEIQGLKERVNRLEARND